MGECLARISPFSNQFTSRDVENPAVNPVGLPCILLRGRIAAQGSIKLTFQNIAADAPHAFAVLWL